MKETIKMDRIEDAIADFKEDLHFLILLRKSGHITT